MKILDCTTRDGGHLNKWHFNPDFAASAYKTARDAGVDVYEIGYRYPDHMRDLGIFGYCTDDKIEEIIGDDISDNCLISVMIDTGKCETSQFDLKHRSYVSVVRVAAYPYELEKAMWQVEELYEKGYKVFLNPMACSELRKDDFYQLNSWKNKDIVEAIVFADSFGTFVPDDIIKNIAKFKGLGFQKVGFHAHNNLQMAVTNSLTAMQHGADWVDATAFGIGRGAGNAQMEILLGVLNRYGGTYNIFPYLELSQYIYRNLYNELNWSIRPQTIMGGLKNVHPYYMEDLFARGLGLKDIWQLLDRIKVECPISYSKTAVSNILD